MGYFVLLLLVICIYLVFRDKKREAEFDKKQQELNKLQQQVVESQKQANIKASQIIAQAELQGNEILEKAMTNAKLKAEKATSQMETAVREAEKIIEEARKKAHEIAGEAFVALEQKGLLEKGLKAIKNQIEGYGDAYVIPTHSVLDDLAEEYGHTQAATDLKGARDRSKAMVKTGTAAVCDYVENNRKETAIRFVLDAFNGKVDTIIARLNKDNVGTLTQEVNDAFALVNLNGAAFRNAKITDEYLASRLAELKFGAIVMALKEQEKEEQRQIKEQIREEEKAKKEYEKAMRDAAKEEDRIKKALDKARQEVALASEEQKQKFEQQIQELTEKLKAAEEKNQRALSMAQLTRSGHVYVISNIGSFGEDVFKIGMTRRLEPMDRVKELGDASVPFSFDVHAMIYSEDAPTLEKSLHSSFESNRVNRVNYRKEFFRTNLAQIRDSIEGLGLKAKFTMLAEAREYRESQAFDKLPDDEKIKLKEHLAQESEELEEEEGA